MDWWEFYRDQAACERGVHPKRPPEYYGRQLMQPVGIWRVDGGPGTPDGSIQCDIPAS